MEDISRYSGAMRPGSTLLIIVISLLGSCSVVTRIELADDLSARVATNITASAEFLRYWKDLAELDPRLPISPLDPLVLRASLEAQTKTIPAKLANPKVTTEGKTTTLTFSVPDSRKVISTSWFQVTRTDQRTRVLVTLDRKTLRALASLTTWGNSPALATLLPSDAAAVTQNDYAQLLNYLLEPYASDTTSLVAQSMVELRLQLPSPPVSTEGVLSVSGSTLVARWPLIRLLSLETPVTLTAVY